LSPPAHIQHNDNSDIDNIDENSDNINININIDNSTTGTTGSNTMTD
jgi:hypothetical protein